MATPFRLAVLVVLGLLVGGQVGCGDERMALNRSRAMATADAFVERQGLEWGPVSEVWSPGSPDVYGRRWWQIDFGHAGGVLRPVVLVDADSGWPRFPRPDEAIRRRLAPRRPSTTDDVAPVGDDDAWPGRLADGEWVAILIRNVRDRDDLVARAVELNQRARQRGIRPLFSVRQDAAGRGDLVFGWDGVAGIHRDEVVLQLLRDIDAPEPVAWEWLGSE